MGQKRLVPNGRQLFSIDSGYTPILNETLVSTERRGVKIGETIINYEDKRFFIGMGLTKTPLELTNVINLNVSGETPSTSVVYNAGTIIINTVDNLAWIGTGNTTTEGSFISLQSGAAISLDGGSF
jgi:hypothetical protein